MTRAVPAPVALPIHAIIRPPIVALIDPPIVPATLASNLLVPGALVASLLLTPRLRLGRLRLGLLLLGLLPLGLVFAGLLVTGAPFLDLPLFARVLVCGPLAWPADLAALLLSPEGIVLAILAVCATAIGAFGAVAPLLREGDRWNRHGGEDQGCPHRRHQKAFHRVLHCRPYGGFGMTIRPLA